MKMVKILTAVIAAAALLTPVYGVAATEPTQACKDCVTKCVMEKNKDGRDCLHVHPAAPDCECDKLCAGVERKSLMQKLREEARAKCKLDYDTCMKEAGSDALKQNVCNLNKGVCDQHVMKMF
jgi:hypothetical protein